MFIGRRKGGDDPVKNNCDRDAPKSGCTVNVETLCGSGQTITLAATDGSSERERVICLTVIRRKLIWDTHKQAHAGVQRVLAKLRLRWYWPSMERDVRFRVERCEICQASKHSRLPGEAGRRRLYAGRPWQVVADGSSERERVICLTAIRRELIWDTHKQAHAGVQRMLAKLRLRWYWVTSAASGE